MISKYKTNLKVEAGKVYSYKTHVATLNHAEKEIIQLGWWSQTTQKHINYVARELAYTVVEQNNN